METTVPAFMPSTNNNIALSASLPHEDLVICVLKTSIKEEHFLLMLVAIDDLRVNC